MSRQSRRGLYAAIAIIIIVIVIIVGVFAYMSSISPSSNANAIQITLYAGEVSTTSYGFGNSSSSIASPGPTLTLKVGQAYTVTVNNAGTMPHGWEITAQKATGSQVLFGAQIAPTSYLSPGASGSVTFTPDIAGNYYYICPVPGHVGLGMWGNIVVTS